MAHTLASLTSFGPSRLGTRTCSLPGAFPPPKRHMLPVFGHMGVSPNVRGTIWEGSDNNENSIGGLCWGSLTYFGKVPHLAGF